LILTVNGNGQVEQKAVRIQVGEPRVVSRTDLARLLALLRRSRRGSSASRLGRPYRMRARAD
jgi:hypothetical protein